METDMKNLFESKKVYASGATTPSSPDAKIIFMKAPFIQYEQILLDKNFRQYLETIMVSKKYCVWVCKKHPYKRHRKEMLGQIP